MIDLKQYKEKGFDSKEEYIIFIYLTELKEAGYIEYIIPQPEPFKLFIGLKKRFYRFVKLKTGSSKRFAKKQHLLNPREYTTDYHVKWSKKSKFIEDVFDYELDNNIPFKVQNKHSYLEVKGGYDKNGDQRLFNSRTAPWMWNKFNIYVQLIKPYDLMKATFIPKEILHEMFYKKSGKWGKIGDKKFKWGYKTLEEYIK